MAGGGEEFVSKLEEDVAKELETMRLNIKSFTETHVAESGKVILNELNSFTSNLESQWQALVDQSKENFARLARAQDNSKEIERILNPLNAVNVDSSRSAAVGLVVASTAADPDGSDDDDDVIEVDETDLAVDEEELVEAAAAAVAAEVHVEEKGERLDSSSFSLSSQQQQQQQQSSSQYFKGRRGGGVYDFGSKRGGGSDFAERKTKKDKDEYVAQASSSAPSVISPAVFPKRHSPMTPAEFGEGASKATRYRGAASSEEDDPASSMSHSK